MRRIIAILLVVFLASTPSYAVTGVPDSTHWVAAGFGGAGAFPMILADHFTANKLYGIGDVNSPFVSTDSADHWSFLSQVGAVNSGFTPTQTASFVQSTNDANLMFALDSASGGLARSLDGGQTWTKVAGFANSKGQKVIAIDKNNDNNIFVASFSTLYKSNDKGLTWTNLGRPFDSRGAAYTTQSACTAAGAGWSTSLGICAISIRFVYHDAVNNDLYLGSLKWGMVKYDLDTNTQEYIDFSGTNGLYVNTFDTYLDGSAVENLCVATGNRIACTSDFSTWSYTSTLTALSTYYINTFAIHRKADSSINIVANRRLISSAYTNTTSYSTDGGSTWSSASLSNNSTMNPTGAYNAGNLIFYIEDDPHADNRFWLSTDWRFYRSENSGASFAEKVIGAQMQVSHDIKVAPNGRIFQMAMDTGVQYSDDFGASWVQGTPSSAKGQPYVTGSVNDYGGHYWQAETAGTPEEWDSGQGKIFICATMYGSHPSLYFVNYVLRSLDSGVTWTRSNSGLPTVDLYGDAIWGTGYCRAMGLSADESKLYVAMDGEDGATKGGLFLSTDDGATFSRVWSEPRKVFNALAVDPTDPTGNTLMFGTHGYNLYRSTYYSENAELNGSGQTRTGNLNNSSYVVSSSITFTSTGGEIFTDNGAGVLTSNLGGTGTINTTTGAYSLTFISTPSTTTATYKWRGYVSATNYIVDVAYDYDGTPYAVGNDSGPTIFRSVSTPYGDGSGQWGTWTKIKQLGTSGMADGLAIDPQNKNRIFVSTTEGSSPSGRRIWVTPNVNLGIWYDITGDFPVAGGCRALAINYHEGTRGSLYCASNGGGIWKLALDDSPSHTAGRTYFGGGLEN